MQLVTHLLLCIRLSFHRTDTTVPQLLSSAPPDLPDHEALDLILQQLKSRSNTITTPVNFLFLKCCFSPPFAAWLNNSVCHLQEIPDRITRNICASMVYANILDVVG